MCRASDNRGNTWFWVRESENLDKLGGELEVSLRGDDWGSAALAYVSDKYG